MATVERNVTNIKSQGVTDDGSVVDQRTTQIDTTADKKTTAVNIVWYIYGVLATFLALRFILKLLGANSSNAFVDFIYAVSGVFSAPFDTVFGVTAANTDTIQSVFEPSILVAIALYGLLAWGIAKLLTLNERH